MKAVSIILKNSKGQILAVSRKTNHLDFGLPGGKIEDEDLNFDDAIRREVKEETGLEIYDLQIVHNDIWNGVEEYTYYGKYFGMIYTNEPHIVKWVHPIEITKGSFGEYNKKVLTSLNLI
jgi:8-oxo-dGTP pyrophosphatase MutT (NUDIX family)